MKLHDSETIKNLARAFASECQEGAKYQFMATVATEEKYEYIKTIIKAVAKNEMAHAKVFFDHILNNCPKVGTIGYNADFPFFKGTLLEMLRNAESNEKKVTETVYPDFEAMAKKEGFTEIAKSFNQIGLVEKRHMNMFKTLADCIENGNLYKDEKSTMWICSNCGFVHQGKEAWEICPLCGVPQGYVQINLQQK